MSSAEMVGDLMTGSAVAAAVEPAGPSAHGHDETCLNCGTRLVGPHCHSCGQAGHVHRTLGGFAHDIAHGVFHFEGKFWHTLPMLAFRPGQLTRRYVDGERAKFVSPVAMFLFSIFLMFTIVSNLGASGDIGDASSGFFDGLTETRVDLSRETEKAHKEVVRLEKRRAGMAADDEDLKDLDADLADARRTERALRQTSSAVRAPADASPKVKADAAAATHGGAAAKPSPDEVENWFKVRVAHARENPKLMLYKMKTAAYKYSWALIPLSLPFLWLMFAWRRRFGLYDHAIFATYSLSFMSLLVVALSLVLLIPSNSIDEIAWFAFFVIPPVHMYKQLRHGYRIRRFSAAWRTAALLIVVSITSTLFFLMLLYLGVAD